MDSKLVLFVHGLGGSARRTWRQFPQLVSSDDELGKPATSSWQYPTSLFRLPLSRKSLGIQTLARGLATTCKLEQQKHQSIVLVCHSLGGLVARKYLIDARKKGDNTPVKGLALYATPNDGASLAAVGRLISVRHNHLKQLAKSSDLIEELNEDWFNLGIGDSLPMVYVVGGLDRVVSERSARGYWGNPDVETVVGKGHKNLVKPTSHKDESYRILSAFIRGELTTSNYRLEVHTRPETKLDAAEKLNDLKQSSSDSSIGEDEQ